MGDILKYLKDITKDKFDIFKFFKSVHGVIGKSNLLKT